MSLPVRRIIMIVASICCTCLAALGFTGSMSPIVGALGWVAAGIFALTEVQYVNMEQKVLAEVMAEAERIEKNG